MVSARGKSRAMRVHALATAVLAASVAMPSCSRVRAFCVPSSSRAHRPTRRSSLTGTIMSHRRRTQHARTTTPPLHMAFDPDVTPGALDAFHAWLTKSGVRLTDNAVLAGRSPLAGGRGLVAARAIETGQSVLAIPQSIGLTATGLKSSGIAQYVKGFEGWTGETGLIALQVLWERAQGEGSKMAPWIAVLPKEGELEMPLFWGEADLTLADASSTRGISGFVADVDEDFAWLSENAFAKHPKVFPTDMFGPGDFRWAVGVALSRSFFVDGELRLTPLVDFANHSSLRGVSEPTGGTTGLFGSKAVVLRAGKNYEEGEEFFASYGPKGAAGYLEENGFVPPVSGSEVTCELEFSIPEDDKFFDDKEDILESAGLRTSSTFDLTAVGLPDAELVRFLRLLCVSGDDAFLLEGIFRNEVWDFMNEPVSRPNEEAVNELLATRCEDELKAFFGTAKEEEDIVSGKVEASERQRLCAGVRQGERMALQMTRSWCESDSKALDRKEYYQERRLKELQLDLPWEVDEIYPTERRPGGGELDW
ncbi:unnamed protein product [Ectocarpus sp. 4 AP-2014]